MVDSDVERWVRGEGLEIALIVIGALLVARFVHWVGMRYSRRFDERLGPGSDVVPTDRQRQNRVVAQAVEWLVIGLVYFSAALMIVTRFGVPLASLVASATVLGVALGFGAQQIVQDLLAGFFLLSEHSFRFGDYIRISHVGATEGISGTVEELTLRTTKLRTVSGELVIVPNGKIEQVTNLSREWVRVVVDVPVRADVDLEAAIAILADAAAAMSRAEQWQSALLEEPAVWGVESIRVGYVLVRMTTRTVPDRQWDVGRELRRRAAEALREADMNPNRLVVEVS